MNRPDLPQGQFARDGEPAPEAEEARDFADTQVSLPFPFEPTPGEGRPASSPAFREAVRPPANPRAHRHRR